MAKFIIGLVVAFALMLLLIPGSTTTAEKREKPRQEQPVITDPDNESAYEILVDAMFDSGELTQSQHGVFCALDAADPEGTFREFERTPPKLSASATRGIYDALVGRC